MSFKSVACLSAILCLISSPSTAQQGAPQNYGHGYWDGPWHGWFMGPAMMVLFFAVVVIAIVFIVRWLDGARGRRPSGGHVSSGTSALDILKERFARGEIDKAEYEERREILRE